MSLSELEDIWGDDILDHPPARKTGHEIGKLESVLEQIAAEDADRARKRCIKLMRGILGDGGLQSFLKSPQPAYDDLTGDQILVRDPHGLLAKLQEIEGRATE